MGKLWTALRAHWSQAGATIGLRRRSIDVPEMDDFASGQVSHPRVARDLGTSQRMIVHLLVDALAWDVIPSRASVASSGSPVWGSFSSAWNLSNALENRGISAHKPIE
jgi:hypothetical protein